MKKKIALLLASMICVFMVAGCGGGSGDKTTPSPEGTTTAAASPAASQPAAAGSETPETEAQYSIKVGASPAPHAEMLELIREDLMARGVYMEVVQFTDYVQPNIALTNGDIDANFFQHIQYLTQYNEDNGTDLQSLAGIHFEPMAIYPGKSKDLASIADGATIAVPNDVTNEARALNLLAAEGLIKVKEGVGLKATKRDIIDNPKNLDIKELEAAQLPRALADVDFAIINGNYAISNGISMDDALAVEGEDQATTMINVIAIRAGEQDKEELKLLAEVMCSEKMRKFLDEEYKGAVVPVFGDGTDEEQPTSPQDEVEDTADPNAPTSPRDEEKNKPTPSEPQSPRDEATADPEAPTAPGD